MMSKPTFRAVPPPEMPDGVDYRFRVHEVLLSFNNDEDATHFRRWWNDRGFKLFDEWTEASIEAACEDIRED